MREKMNAKINVAIVDDHQGIIDGYLYRLEKSDEIQVVGTANFGEEIEPLLANQHVDVLLLDVQVPVSRENSNPYPILYLIPKLLNQFEDLNIVVISMFAQRTLIKSVQEAGASGYILKEDRDANKKLVEIVKGVYNGGMHYSKKAWSVIRGHFEITDAPLTQRQIEVLSYYAAFPDLTTAQLANSLHIAHSTVRNLLSGAYLRLEVNNRTAAINKAREMALITPIEELPNLESLETAFPSK
jgi:two-component system nitrate/nitrite response regulator NarL